MEIKSWVVIVIGILAFLAFILSVSNDNVVDEVTHFAEIYYHSYSTPYVVEIPFIDTYYKLNVTTLSALSGFTQNESGLVVQKDAVYKIVGSISFSGENTGVYEVEVHRNNAGMEKCVFFRTLSINSLGVGALTCIVELSKGDFLNVKVKDLDAPAQNIVFQQFNLNIVEMH